MEIILLEKVTKLGDIGQTVNVKPGYARNFLFPNKMAIRATAENKQVFEKQKEQLQKANIVKKKEAENIISKAPNSIVIFREASEQGALFGSVTSRDIAKEIITDDLNVSAKDIIVKSNIKNIGEFQVKVVLHPEVSKEIKVIVEKSEESLKN